MMRPSLNDILREIRDWKIEVQSWRNDGWTRAHYMIMLEKVKKEIESMDPYEIPATLQQEAP
tara:strand:- start:515 stop:700 length:186 start_codon:yes stop_codon:yes gene_type:complete